jgi:hypothetical protein
MMASKGISHGLAVKGQWLFQFVVFVGMVRLLRRFAPRNDKKGRTLATTEKRVPRNS